MIDLKQKKNNYICKDFRHAEKIDNFQNKATHKTNRLKAHNVMRMIKVENKRESAKKKEIEQSRKKIYQLCWFFMFFEWQKEFIHHKIFTISDSD